MSSHTRGRCKPCEIVWEWPRGERALRGTKCPRCSRQLEQTAQNVKARRRRYPIERVA
jgi:uncharacterized paraquat-inducible protein A